MSDWGAFVKRMLIFQGVLLFIAILFSLARHLFAKSLNKHRSTAANYYRRLFKSQLWVYLISLLLFALVQIIRYYNKLDYIAEQESKIVTLSAKDVLNMNIVTDVSKRDSLVKALAISEKYEKNTRKLIGYIDYTLPYFIDTACAYQHNSDSSASHIKVLDVIATYETNYLDDETYWVKVVYIYKHDKDKLRHVILYHRSNKTIIESLNSGRYFDLSQWKDEDLENEPSDIEVRLIDTSVILDIKSDYESKHNVDTPGKDSWREEHYLANDSIISWILYDSSNNVIALYRWSGDSLFYSGEFYDNGQQKRQIFRRSLSENDTVFTRYYYRDGRVRSEGYLTDKQIGKWYTYDSTGKLKYMQIH